MQIKHLGSFAGPMSVNAQSDEKKEPKLNPHILAVDLSEERCRISPCCLFIILADNQKDMCNSTSITVEAAVAKILMSHRQATMHRSTAEAITVLKQNSFQGHVHHTDQPVGYHIENKHCTHHK